MDGVVVVLRLKSKSISGRRLIGHRNCHKILGRLLGGIWLAGAIVAGDGHKINRYNALF